MYKLLLCWRYLRTRFLAVICIISVMLGVATLVVVNSVMSGFSTKLKDRLHGLLSDIVIETPNYNGFPLTDDQMLDQIRKSPAGPYIAAMTPTIEVVAMMNFEYTARNDRDSGLHFVGDRQKVTRPIHLVGIDPKGRAEIGGFAEHLTDHDRQANPSFDLNEEARKRFEVQNRQLPRLPRLPPEGWPAGVPLPEEPPDVPHELKGAIIGFAISSYKDKDPNTGALNDVHVLQPGDTVSILTVGQRRQETAPVYSPFVVAGFIKTEMAEYDSSYVFVPLDFLQELRDSGPLHERSDPAQRLRAREVRHG